MLPEVTPATRLLEKRRQQHEADEALEAAKQQYATQARQLPCRWRCHLKLYLKRKFSW